MDGGDSVIRHVRLSTSLQQLPQHRLQDPAVAVVLQLDGCIDAAGRHELDRVAFAIRDAYFHVLSRLERIVDEDLERADACEAKRRTVLAALEHQRQDAHADEVAAMNALEA